MRKVRSDAKNMQAKRALDTAQGLALVKLIHIFGSQKEIANIAGVSQQAVSRWFLGLSDVDSLTALKIEKASNGEVLAHDLCRRMRAKA